MSVQFNSGHNMISTKSPFANSKGELSNGANFWTIDLEEKAPTKVKIGSALASLTGIGIVMARVFKSKGLKSKNPIEFLKNFTKVTYEDKDRELPMLVTKLALGSVGGGLLGGALLDKKENFKAKVRESVIQLVGNIFTPLACVMVGLKGAKFLEKKLPKILPAEAKKTKLAEAAISAMGLLAGIFSGNEIGNYINKKFFYCDDKRKIKMSDMSPHIDDLCVTGAIIGKDFDAVPRFIPLALTIAGYSVGTAQETFKMKCKEAFKQQKKEAMKMHAEAAKKIDNKV